MSHGEQFTLYCTTSYIAPNPWKVAFVLEELGLTYESIYLDFSKGEHKAPEHTKYNPNGRIPTLIDHANDNFAVWESDAILHYLVEKYDVNHKISVSDPSEKILQLQWLFFQASGQGAYFGQGSWFKVFHPEKLPSAVERYNREIIRVFGVLDGVLSEQEWLVGGKLTIADLAFIPWTEIALNLLMPDFPEYQADMFPHFLAWHKKLLQQESVAKVLAIQKKLLAQ